MGRSNQRTCESPGVLRLDIESGESGGNTQRQNSLLSEQKKKIMNYLDSQDQTL